jgi:hypothetical protein
MSNNIKNDNKVIKDSKNFVVFGQEAGKEAWTNLESLVPINFRKQLRGLGAASFNIIGGKTQEKEIDIIRNLRKIVIVDNRPTGEDDFKDISGATSLEEIIGVAEILWCGAARSITLDVLVAKTGFRGYMEADEIGMYFSSTPIHYSEPTPEFNPIYNGICYGNAERDEDIKIIGASFRNSDFAVRKTDSKITWTDEFKVWRLGDIIDYIWNKNTSGTVVFPWMNDDRIGQDIKAIDEKTAADTRAIRKKEKLDISRTPPVNHANISAKAQEEIDKLETEASGKKEGLYTKYKYFFNTDVGSFSNYEGVDVISAIDELLPPPFDFYLEYNTSLAELDSPTLVIVNTTSVDLPEMAPGAQGIDWVVSEATSKVETLNITFENSEVYDKVILLGNYYLWAGTMSTWNIDQDATLLPAWSKDQEEAYIRGTLVNPDEKEFGDSIESGIARQYINNVFRKFNFATWTTGDDGGNWAPIYPEGKSVWYDDNGNFSNPEYVWNPGSGYAGVIQDSFGIPMISNWSGNISFESWTNQYKSLSKLAFFGTFEGIDLDPNSGGDKIKLYEEPYIDCTLNNHKTPNKLASAWADFLPFTSYTAPTSANFVISDDSNLATPFVIAATCNVDEDRQYWYNLSDNSFPSIGTCQIRFHENGLIVDKDNPITSSWYVDQLFTQKQGGVPRGAQQPAIDLGDVPAEVLPFNPDNDEYDGKTNWQRYLVTIAGRSKDRLEGYKVRKNGDGTNVESVQKTKVIIDDSLEVWLVHNNTVRGLIPLKSGLNWEDGRDNTYNGLLRFQLGAGVNSENEFNKHYVTVMKDDRKLLLSLLEGYANFYFQQKMSMRLETGLFVNTQNKLGLMVKNVIDNGAKINGINTCVASIEWVCSGDTPRVIYATNLPEIPLLTKSFQDSTIASGKRPEYRRDAREDFSYSHWGKLR